MNRERHGFVTFWLLLIAVSNAIFCGIYFYRTFTTGNISYFNIGFLSLVAVAASILLLCWIKIGFWIFLAVQILCIPINISLGVNKIQSVTGLLSVIILGGILRMSKNGRTAWDYLSSKNIDEKPSSADQGQLKETKPLFTPVSGETWVCKKCGELNSSTSSSCKGCGEYK
jgi:hypothetical protein